MEEPLTHHHHPLETFKKTRAKGISLVFVFSLLLYAIVLHIFNLSPSDLINNTKFWFLISNTLILIIATDYGAFLSSSSSSSSYFCSSSSANFGEECAMIRRQRSAFSTRTRFTGCTNPSIPEESPVIHQIDQYHCRPLHDQVRCTTDNLRDKLQLQLTVQKNRDAASEIDQHGCVDMASLSWRRRQSRRKSRRSRSVDNPKRVVFDESRNVVRLIECQRDDDEQQRAWECCNYNYDNYDENEDDDDNNCTKADEYSRLSNEELNQRVEDFINRFNNQIRVQAEVYN